MMYERGIIVNIGAHLFDYNLENIVSKFVFPPPSYHHSSRQIGTLLSHASTLNELT